MDNYSPEAIPDPVPNVESDRKGSFKRFMFDVAETLILSVVLFLVINTLSARIRIESISMQPTLYENDFVFVNRLAYKLGTPGRGDIIVFRYPPDPQREPYIKRVIGLPGETVKVENGEVFVNDTPIRESYIKASPAYQGTWVVPEDYLFVLGDNRNNSSDSHSWGMVPIANVIGKAEVIYLPVSHWRVLNPRMAAAAEPNTSLP
jgi:signal peptidase I